METIKNLLNKIKWDKRQNPSDYTLFYEDRIEKTLKEIRYRDIKKIEGNFLLIEKDNRETYIPLHRIKKVKRKEMVVWKR